MNSIISTNKHFYSVSDFYKNKFGCKVYKLSLNAGCTCPNRDGTKGFGGCIFCNESGSGDFASSSSFSILEQIEQAKKLVMNKNKNGKYISYFQNFTSTYGNEVELLKKFNESISSDEIVGLSIATRPDCLSDTILKGLSEISKKTFLSIELGFQTSKKSTIEYIRRCYDNQEYISAIDRIRSCSPNIHIVTHVIFGLPGEDGTDMLNSIRFVNKSNVDGIKISLLHVLKDTDLANDYESGKFECMKMEDYFSVLGKALNIIPKGTIIHRLTGDGAKKNLIAPLWSANKKDVYNKMIKYFFDNRIEQGKDV